ncbi:MAG: bifunctional phosphopantothenoylcysteine decarboxylase/phosphopantothenate--cysteine ligase CoaBC [Clostridia bacterium]|nr:bifunctional phosphopantothenoylcysteine decarboxylase/phosphopantothenate--cysteine ligase CoaBC [Clostridia bacterium]
MNVKRNVVVGVTGGIAAYKSCELVSRLVKAGYGVKVVMTEHAKEFVSPLTFETLSKNAVICDMFAPKPHFEVEHVSLAKWAGVYVIAPATANVIAKIAGGVADDMLTTSFMATEATRIVCPAMNTVMYKDDATQKNLAALKERGVKIIEPGVGRLACGDVGVGRMEEPEEIFEQIDRILTPNPDYRGKRVLVTAGGTSEDIDGVRFIGNRSSGKMGAAIAEAVLARGGEVTFVYGNISVPVPNGVKAVRVVSTQDMYDAVLKEMEDCDVIIKSAAPADYRVKEKFTSKIKSETLTLELVKNPDIAKAVGERKVKRILVDFAAETHDLLKNAAKKLASKNADLIVANDVTEKGAGFNSDTNIATLLYADGRMESLPIMPKTELADTILDAIQSL